MAYSLLTSVTRAVRALPILKVAIATVQQKMTDWSCRHCGVHVLHHSERCDLIRGTRIGGIADSNLSWLTSGADTSGGVMDEESMSDGAVSKSNMLSPKFVPKHNPNDKIALVGGNPSRRRKLLERKLRPYELLDLYGSPKDVGPNDIEILIKKIKMGAYDVVYRWTRFNSHSSRILIRDACGENDTKFVEIESLSHIVETDSKEPGTE